MEKMASDGPKWGQEDFFPTNPDLADILGRTDLNFENFYFLVCWTPIFWISRSPDLKISGFPGPQISKFPAKFPDFQRPPADEFSDPNLTPLPTHPTDPGIRHVVRSPCCDEPCFGVCVWV